MNSKTLFAVAVSGLVLAATTHAVGDERHSGTIVAIEPQAHAITLEEMGPWTGPGQGLIKRLIELTAQTDVALLARSESAKAGEWPGAFTASPLSATELRTGDYVTTSVEAHGGRLVARSIAVVRSSAAGPKPATEILPSARTDIPVPRRTRIRGGY